MSARCTLLIPEDRGKEKLLLIFVQAPGDAPKPQLRRDVRAVPAASRRAGHGVVTRTTVLSARLLALLLPPLALMHHEAAYATAADQPELVYGETLRDRFDRRLQPRVSPNFGALRLKPVAELGVLFDDNIFASSGNRESDVVTRGRARLRGEAEHDDDRYRFDLGTEKRMFLDNPNENTWTYAAKAGGQWRASRFVTLDASGGAQRLVVPRDDPNPINGLKPASFHLYDANAGITLGADGRTSLAVHGGFARVAFNPVDSTFGNIDTRERDNDTTSVVVRLEHRPFARQTYYVETRADRIDYRRTVDTNGFRRSSDGGRIDFGAIFDVGGPVALEAAAGLQQRRYKDDRFGRITNLTYKLAGIWRPSLLTEAKVSYSRDFRDEVYFASPGYIRRELALQVDHELQRDVLLTGIVGREWRSLQRTGRGSVVTTGTLRGEKQLAGGFSLVADVTHSRQTGARNFHRNLVTLSGRLNF